MVAGWVQSWRLGGRVCQLPQAVCTPVEHRSKAEAVDHQKNGYQVPQALCTVAPGTPGLGVMQAES